MIVPCLKAPIPYNQYRVPFSVYDTIWKIPIKAMLVQSIIVPEQYKASYRGINDIRENEDIYGETVYLCYTE